MCCHERVPEESIEVTPPGNCTALFSPALCLFERPAPA